MNHHSTAIGENLAPPDDLAVPTPWRIGSLRYSAGGLALLFLLLLVGDFAWALKERGVTPLFQVELRNHGASDFLVGLFVGSLPAIISAVATPVISVWSDRTRTRWGRRIPFLVLPTPVITLALIALAQTRELTELLSVPLGGIPPTTLVLILYGAFWTVFEVSTLVANSVFTGLVNDVVPRTLIGRFFGLFRVVSLGAGILFNTCIIGHAEESFRPILFGIAAVYALGFTIMCLGVREGTYPPPPAAQNGGWGRSFRTYLGLVFGLGYYRRIYAFIAVSAITFLPVNAFSIFAAKSYGLSIEAYGRWMAGAFVVSLLTAYPMGILADRFHPLKVGAGILGFYVVAMLLAWTLVHDGTSYGIAFALHVVLSGAYFTATAALGPTLFPRLHFSQFAAAGIIMTACATMIATPLVGYVLDVLGRPYGLTFPLGSSLALLTLTLWIAVWREFQALGGPAHYQPPISGGDPLGQDHRS
jgi:MFS family permease